MLPYYDSLIHIVKGHLSGENHKTKNMTVPLVTVTAIVTEYPYISCSQLIMVLGQTATIV